MNKELIILKIGGSVITDKASAEPKARLDVIKRIAQEISDAYNGRNFSLIIIHGAGSYGHQIVKRTGIDKGIKNEEQALAFAETQRLQNELDCIFTKILIDGGIPAIPCQASAHAILRKGKIVKMDTEAISGFLEVGLIPVLYGVPAYDIEQGCSILSGDQIAPFLAKKLKAGKIIHGTNVDGIFTKDPNKSSDAKLIPLIDKSNIKQVKKMLTGSAHTDVTGGMFGKVMELKGTKIEVFIANANKPGIIKAALLGKWTGTKVIL